MPTSWHEHWYTKTPNGGTEETKTPNTRHIPRGRSHQTPTRYFVILPFKECFLSKFTSLHSQLPEYVHTECPCIFNFSPLCIFCKECPCLDLFKFELKPGRGPNCVWNYWKESCENKNAISDGRSTVGGLIGWDVYLEVGEDTENLYGANNNWKPLPPWRVFLATQMSYQNVIKTD